MEAMLFEDSISRVLSTVARKNCRCVFSGDQPKTDGDTVFLPALDYRKDVDEETGNIITGFVLHEGAGHVCESDLPLFQKEARIAEASGDHLLKALINAIEDVRVEKVVTNRYDGAKTFLDATCHVVNRQFLDSVLKEQPDIVKELDKIGSVAITWHGRKALGYPSSTLDDCIGSMPAELQKTTKAWADAAMTCQSTADSIALAKMINKETRQKCNMPPPPPPKPDPGPDGEGQGEGNGQDGAADGAGPTNKPVDPNLNIEKVFKAANISAARGTYTSFTADYDIVETINGKHVGPKIVDLR